MMPFPGGIEAPANGTLLLSIGAAFLYLMMLAQPPSMRRTAIKAAAVGLLAVLAWIAGGPSLLVLALTLGAVGDAMLAQDDETSFLAGLGSFLLAHLGYIALFSLAGLGADAFSESVWRIVLVAALVALGLWLLRALWSRLGPSLRLPVAAYTAAILAMGVAAATLPVSLVLIGAVLFILSDALLATERFLLDAQSGHRAWSGPAVWIFYYLGQLCIAVGFLT